MDGPSGVRQKAEDEEGQSQSEGREATGCGEAGKRGPTAPRCLRDRETLRDRTTHTQGPGKTTPPLPEAV